MHTLVRILRDKGLLQPCFYITNIFLLCVAHCTENRRYKSRRGSEHKERAGLSHSILSAGHSMTHSCSPTLTTLLSLLHVHQRITKFPPHCRKVSRDKFDKVCVGGWQAVLLLLICQALAKMQMYKIPNAPNGTKSIPLHLNQKIRTCFLPQMVPVAVASLITKVALVCDGAVGRSARPTE